MTASFFEAPHPPAHEVPTLELVPPPAMPYVTAAENPRLRATLDDIVQHNQRRTDFVYPDIALTIQPSADPTSYGISFAQTRRPHQTRSSLLAQGCDELRAFFELWDRGIFVPGDQTRFREVTNPTMAITAQRLGFVIENPEKLLELRQTAETFNKFGLPAAYERAQQLKKAGMQRQTAREYAELLQSWYAYDSLRRQNQTAAYVELPIQTPNGIVTPDKLHAMLAFFTSEFNEWYPEKPDTSLTVCANIEDVRQKLTYLALPETQTGSSQLDTVRAFANRSKTSTPRPDQESTVRQLPAKKPLTTLSGRLSRLGGRALKR